MDSFLSKPITIPFITSINLNGLPSVETFHLNGLSFNLHKAFHENHEHPECLLTMEIIDGDVVDVFAKGNVSRRSKNYFVVEDYHQYMHAPFPITFEFEFKPKRINFCLASQTVDIPYNVLKYLKFGEYYQRNISLTPKELQGKVSKDITFNGYWTRKIDAMKWPIFEYYVVNKKGIKMKGSEKDCIYHVPDLHQYPKSDFQPQNLTQTNSMPFPGQNGGQQQPQPGNIPMQQQNGPAPLSFGPNNTQPPMAPQQRPPPQIYGPMQYQQLNGPSGHQPGYGMMGPRPSYPSFPTQNVGPSSSIINGNGNHEVPLHKQQLLKQQIQHLEVQKQELQQHQQHKKVQLHQLQQQAELQQKRDLQKLFEDCGATLPPHLAPQPQMYGPNNSGYRQMPLPTHSNSFEINFFIDLDVFENLVTEIEKTCSETISDENENCYGDFLFINSQCIPSTLKTKTKNIVVESQKPEIELINVKQAKEYQTATVPSKSSNDEAVVIISEKNPPKSSDDEEKIINDEIEKLQERLQNILKSDQIVDKPVSRVTSQQSSSIESNEMNEANNGWSDLRPEDFETSKVQEKSQKAAAASKRFDYSEISTVSFPPNQKLIKSPRKISSSQNSSEVENIDTTAPLNLKNPTVLQNNDGIFQPIFLPQNQPKGMSEAWKEKHPGWEKGVWDFPSENEEKIEKNAVQYNSHISEKPNNNLSKSHFDKDKRDVFVHVQAGETLTINIGPDSKQICGPATIRLISPSSSNSNNVLPLRVPPGHIVQQILDKEGRLNHIILSPCASRAKESLLNVEEMSKNVDKHFQLNQKLQQAKPPKGMSEAWKERHPGWERGVWDFQPDESIEIQEDVDKTDGKNCGFTLTKENDHVSMEREKSSPSKPDSLEDDDYITISDDDDETNQEDYQEEVEEEITCYCGEKNYGDMIWCENEDCPYKWFHFECVGILFPPIGKWWCFDCSLEKGLNFCPTKAWLKKYHSQGKEKVVSQKQFVNYFAKENPSQNGKQPLKNNDTIAGDEHHSTDSSISRPSSSETDKVSKKWGAFFICRDGAKVYGRKEKLSKISPILRAIIDSSKTNISEIETDFDSKIMEVFVKYSNGDENGIIGNEIELYKVAKLYSVDKLKDKCVITYISRT